MASTYEVVCDTKDRKVWLEARRAGVGASDMAAVLGEHPYSSALSVYVDKIKAANDNTEEEQSEAAEWGLRLEPVLIDAFRERTGRPVLRGKKLLRSLAHPWALTTLDAWTGDGSSTWPFQVKTTSFFLEDRWVNGPPEYYRIQQHHEMLVTGATKHSIACLIGGQKFIWCDIERDESLIERIVRQGAEFWQLVQARALPVPDGSEATREAIRRLYPSETGEIMKLDESYLELTHEILGLKERRGKLTKTLQQLQTDIDARENRIRLAMGSATIAQLPDYSTWTWETQTRRGYSVAATSFRALNYSRSKPLMREIHAKRRARKAVGE